jgi:hypothetical protein
LRREEVKEEKEEYVDLVLEVPKTKIVEKSGLLKLREKDHVFYSFYT